VKKKNSQKTKQKKHHHPSKKSPPNAEIPSGKQLVCFFSQKGLSNSYHRQV